MKIGGIPLIISLLLIIHFSTSVSGQGLLSQGNQNTQEQSDSDSDSIGILPIPSTGISEALNESFSLINELGAERITGEELRLYNSQIDTLFSAVDLFLGDSIIWSSEGISIRELDNISHRADFYIGELSQIRDRLSEDARETEDATEEMLLASKRWQLTIDLMDEEEVPESRLARIQRIIHETDSVRNVMLEDLDTILIHQHRLNDKRNSLESLENWISDQKLVLGERLFSRDMPGFFSELSTLKDPDLVQNHIDQFKKSIRADVAVLKTEYTVPMMFVTLLLIFLLVFAVWYKKHFARLISVEKFELSEIHLTTIYSPVITVFFIIALIIRFVFPNLPQTFSSLNLVILMIPIVIIVIRLFGSLARSWMLTLIVIYVLSFIYELVYYPDIILRMILLLFSLTAFLLFLWMIIKKPLSARFKNKFAYGLFRTILAGFTLLLFLAIIGNLVGAFRMAEFFTLVTIQAVVLAIGIVVTIQVADTIVFLFLASNLLQKLNVFKEEFRTIYRKTIRLINLLLWLFFIVTAMNLFRIKDPFFEWGREVLTSGWKIGAVDITPGSILIFIFVIWLSIFLARIIRHILEKDVFARVSTAKGMPSTIILLVRIGLITGGFFLAAAAAGMKLTNLSIVLGAFSVGIGFGLQNIFNNMVSGLILAFERPIKVGDTVQVGELIGIVLSIGLRSSTVRSFDGAEVIVPNGNLISNQMINWTLSDAYRRMDIRVGVAYGTDPETVLDLMQDVAMGNTQVNKYPAPTAYFLGFGDSSLDFRLLAWTNIDNRLEVESELNVAVNTKLKEAGIEIPFPQRDLHIRSDATKGKK